MRNHEEMTTLKLYKIVLLLFFPKLFDNNCSFNVKIIKISKTLFLKTTKIIKFSTEQRIHVNRKDQDVL